MVHSAATLGAPPAAEHAALHGWLERMSGRPAVRREIDAMSRFVAALLAPSPAREAAAPPPPASF
jgi:hypothetical protein